MKPTYQIPFDYNGNQLHYTSSVLDTEGRWVRPLLKDNFEIYDTLEIMDYQRGRSAAYFTGKLLVSEIGVTMFMSDFIKILPKMAYGRLTGLYTFGKKGMNFGIKLLN